MKKEVLEQIEKSQSPWLLKTAGRIMGPFSAEEVAEKLRSREIVALDEAIAPLGRWKYVIDHPTFRELAQQMKEDSSDEAERTMTSTIDSSMVDDMTKTVELDHKTPTFDKTNPNFERPKAEPVKSYGFQSDRNIEKEASSQSKPIWIAAIIVLLGVIGVVLFKEMSKTEKGGNSSQLIKQGRLAASFGENKKAIDFFIRALKNDQSNPEALLPLIPLIAQEEKDPVLARRLLKELEAISLQSAEIYNLHGLIDLLEDKVEDAEKAFDRALALDSHYSQALVNKMIVSYRKKQYSKVEESFEELQKLGVFDGAATFILSLALTEDLKQRGDTGQSAQVYKQIDQYLETQSAYKQELTLIKNYLLFNQKKDRVSSLIRDTINMDPYLSPQHSKDFAIYQEAISWSQLLPLCQEVYQKVQSVLAESLYSFCLIKTRRTLEAQKLLNQTAKKDPKNFWPSTVQAFYLVETHHEDKGLQLLEHIANQSPSYMALSLIGFYCEKAQKGCAERAWNSLLQKDPGFLAALHGKAKIAFQSQDYEKSLEFIRRGLQISSNYIPLKKLEWQIEESY